MARPDLLDQLIDLLTDLTSRSRRRPRQRDAPAARAHELTMNAASQAAAAAGALALPPGPLGMLTIVPDLVAVWHIQRQLVADIAGCYGKSAELRREAMMYCLFRHAAAQVVRDLVMRLGQRLLLRRASMAMMERSLQRVGLAVSQRAIGRTISRWVPIAGAVGVVRMRFYDTVQVGRTARQFFEVRARHRRQTPVPRDSDHRGSGDRRSGARGALRAFAPGPGGQNVNKVATAVELRFNVFQLVAARRGQAAADAARRVAADR